MHFFFQGTCHFFLDSRLERRCTSWPWENKGHPRMAHPKKCKRS